MLIIVMVLIYHVLSMLVPMAVVVVTMAMFMVAMRGFFMSMMHLVTVMPGAVTTSGMMVLLMKSAGFCLVSSMFLTMAVCISQGDCWCEGQG